MSTDNTGSVFVAHLVSYPSVTQAISAVKSFSLVHRASDISKPYIDALNSKLKPYSDAVLEKAQPTITRADQLGDKILSNIDTRFPSLKTVQPSDVISEVKFKIGSAKEKVGATASAAANSVKSKYSQVYDTNGKPYVEGLEGRIAPINNKLDSVIDEYLPGDSAAPASNGELGRSYAILVKAISRITPNAVNIRDSTLAHVQSVYSSQLKESNSKAYTPIYQCTAAVSTGIILSKETLSKVYEYLSGTPAAKRGEAATKPIIETATKTATKTESTIKSTASEAKTSGSESLKKAARKVNATASEIQSAA